MAHILISYIGDLDTSSESVLLVDSDVTYIAACQAIAACTQDDHALEVWVRKKGHLAWLRNFTHQLSIEAEFNEKTPRSLLAQKWGTVIPGWVSDDEIMSQGILELDVDNSVGETFENRLLGNLLDRAFITESISADTVGLILTILAGDQYREVIAKYPLVHECTKRKSLEWRKNSSAKWITALCEYLPEKPLVPLRWCGAWSLLKNYPDELLERVIPKEQIAVVRSIPTKVVEKIKLEPVVREEALTQIKLYLENAAKLVTPNTDFKKIVACMSGRLIEEFKYVLNLLESGNIEPNLDDIALVQRTFNACPGVHPSLMQSLGYLVCPPRPTLIRDSEEWNSDQWLRWTIDEYVPYREWQVRNKKYDEALESTVARFSDWYIESYLTVNADINYGLTYCLNSLNSKMDRHGLSIVLIVDCLPVAYASLMDDALRSAGFNQHSQKYRFASLPTVTEYNKAALLSGIPGNIAKNYSALLSERSSHNWDGAKNYYISSLQALSEFQPGTESTIVVVNYTEGDEILHSDLESKNRSYEDELSRVFTQLSEAVIGVCERWSGSREDIRILLVTDHGACRILNEETKTFSSSVLSKLFDDEKHRMATMTSEQATKIPANLWDLGYRFTIPFSTLDAIHFLPRGHNTVRKAGIGSGYLHGGVTPEEVIVPTAIYGIIAENWKRPVTRFVNVDMGANKDMARFFIQRVTKIEIEVQNANSVPLQVTAIEVLVPEASVKDIRVASLDPTSSAILSIDLYFQKSALGAKALDLKLRYKIGGTEHELVLSLPTEFRSATAPGLNLRDL